MTSKQVTLEGGPPWGFRMYGGSDQKLPLRISRVNPGSKSSIKGIREGDLITSINGESTKDCTNAQAHSMLREAGQTLLLGLNEDTNGSPKRRIYRSVKEIKTETIKESKVSRVTRITSDPYEPSVINKILDSVNKDKEKENHSENAKQVKEFGDICRAHIKTEISDPGGDLPTLRTLCLRAIADQPYGEDILQELAEVAKNLDMNTRRDCRRFVRDVKVTTPPVGMNRRSSTPGSEVRSPPTIGAEDYIRRSQCDGYVLDSATHRVCSKNDVIDLVNIRSPTPSKPENQAWVLGVPTKTDPGVLMCLSKKQSEVKIEPNSADAILDLHSKYLERVTSPDFGVTPKLTKRKEYDYNSDYDETARVENIYKTEIRKTENSKLESDDIKFRKTFESWEDPEYSSDDRTKRLLKNELLRTCKSSCSIPYSLENEKEAKESDMTSIDRLHRLYKSEMRLAQPNKETNSKNNITCPKTDSWIEIFDATSDNNCEESIENRLNACSVDKSSTLSLNEPIIKKPDIVDKRRFSLPKELHEKQMQYILDKERQIQKEIDKLQQEKELLKLEELATKSRIKNEELKRRANKNRIFDNKIQVLDEISELDDCVERLERLAEEARKVDEVKTEKEFKKPLKDKYTELFGELTPHQRLLKEIEEIENLQYPLPRNIDENFYELKETPKLEEIDKPNPFKKMLDEDFDSTDLLKNISAFPKSNITKSYSQYDISEIKDDESKKSKSNFTINKSKNYMSSKKVDMSSSEEKLREQMYSEYMSKVAERENRKHQHVIKLSKIHQEIAQETSSSVLKAKYEIHASSRIENEFMEKVKKRHGKLEVNENDDEVVSEKSETFIPNLKVFDGTGVHICDSTRLPKHLKEFAELTTDLDDDIPNSHVNNDSQNLTCFHENFSKVTISENLPPKIKNFTKVSEFQNLLSDVSDEEALVSEDKQKSFQSVESEVIVKDKQEDVHDDQFPANGESRNARLRFVGIATCVAVVLGWKIIKNVSK